MAPNALATEEGSSPTFEIDDGNLFHKLDAINKAGPSSSSSSKTSKKAPSTAKSPWDKNVTKRRRSKTKNVCCPPEYDMEERPLPTRNGKTPIRKAKAKKAKRLMTNKPPPLYIKERKVEWSSDSDFE